MVRLVAWLTACPDAIVLLHTSQSLAKVDTSSWDKHKAI